MLKIHVKSWSEYENNQFLYASTSYIVMLPIRHTGKGK